MSSIEGEPEKSELRGGKGGLHARGPACLRVGLRACECERDRGG